MTRFLALLFCLVLGMTGTAQQRWAILDLDEGKTVTGLVVAMDIASVQLRIEHKVVSIPVSHIMRCRFEERSNEVPDDAVATAAPDSEHPPAKKPLARPGKTRKGPLPDPLDPEGRAQLPHDLRGQSLLRLRLQALDEAYPWLVPTSPVQWISLGLFLSAAMTLVIHLSTRGYDSEPVGLHRCLALAVWYDLTVVMQLAFLPSGHLSTVFMLLVNPAMALYWLRSGFGLKRGPAVIAYAMQLGFVALGYGTLELITSVIGSTAHAS